MANRRSKGEPIMAQKTFGSTIDPEVVEFTRIVSRALSRARQADKCKEKVGELRVKNRNVDKETMPDP